MGLFDLVKQTPTRSEIKGSFGEWLAKIYAKTFPGTLVLHDVMIDGTDQYKSQIDLLIIGSKGIYVVEMKMYSDAKIYGDTRNAKWHYYSHGKCYEIYSPLEQNHKHVEYLKVFLKDFGDVPCFSVVTMICDDFKISGERIPDTVICSSLPAMERAIYQIAAEKPEIWDKIRQKEIYTHIENYQHQGKNVRTEHKESVVAYKDTLEQMKKQKKCPYCKADLVLRNGKYGAFYGCQNYPKCKYILK